MEQTPIHDQHNPDLLRFIPETAKNIIEVGCSSGALAREFKLAHPDCHWLGIEIDPHFAKVAQLHCDQTLSMDIESATQDFWGNTVHADCWIFGDTLEHLRDPWSILRAIRQRIPTHGSVVACIPNAQHWSIQAKLSIGDFRYETSGLLDRTHLRWFTRQTIFEMFSQTGFNIEAGMSRIFNEPHKDLFLPIIEKMATAAGVDAELAKQDSLALQYVVRAVPV